MCVCVCLRVPKCLPFQTKWCADVDLKANFTEDEIMSLWFQGAGGKHAWTNMDAE